MAHKGNRLINLFKLFIHFVVFLLTLCSSRYHCEELQKGKTVQCYDYGTFGNEDKNCGDKAFILSANGNFFVLCPWSGGVITTISISNVAAMIYIAIAVFQIIKRKYIGEKLMIYGSFTVLPVLILATILMLRDIYHASEQCGLIAMEYYGKKNVTGSCFSKAFGVTFVLSLLSVLLFAYEAMKNFYNYQFKDNLIGDYGVKDKSLKKSLIHNSDSDDGLL